MEKNVKIAKELVRLAKSLVALDEEEVSEQEIQKHKDMVESIRKTYNQLDKISESFRNSSSDRHEEIKRLKGIFDKLVKILHNEGNPCSKLLVNVVKGVEDSVKDDFDKLDVLKQKYPREFAVLGKTMNLEKGIRNTMGDAIDAMMDRLMVLSNVEDKWFRKNHLRSPLDDMGDNMKNELRERHPNELLL